uniref:Uncharacterized protein n=1 Tax=Lutzomyia longipalpis TaxID=7200 RepID=A0A1B0FUZ0_LUTLO
METAINETYDSDKTSKVGFEFQEEILLHLALMLQKLDCKNFSLGYEVKSYPKFDDVVCRFQINEETYMLLIQAKHYENKLITPKILLGKNEDFCLWTYFKRVAEIMKNHKGNEKLKFIFWTTANISKNIWKNSLENSEFTQILNVIYNHDAKLISLDEKIFENLDENEKYIELKTNYQNFNEDSKYFFENFIYVSESPNCEDLKDLNDMLIKRVFKIREEAFYRLLRDNILNFIKIDKEKKRKFMTKSDFEKLSSITMLDVELPRISKAFLDEFPKTISHNHNFKEESLEIIRNILETKSKIIRDDSTSKLNALKVLLSIQKNYSNTLLIPISKLNDFCFEALKSYDKTVVVFVDEEIETEQLMVKENLIFVGKIKGKDFYPELPPFSFDDLTEKSKENILEEVFFKLQGFSVPLRTLKEHTNLLENIFIYHINLISINLGNELPTNKIPKLYIEMSFVPSIHKPDSSKIYEGDLLQKYSHCVVMGNPGIGKSGTLQKVANDFKKENPEFWVEFIELRAFSKVFWEKYNAGNFDFSSEIEAKTFLLDKILRINENSLERELFEFYLTLEKAKILLIFDGFDEIMPTYEKIVLNLIQELKHLNMKIFISGRLHCSSILNELETFEEIELLMYTIDQSIEYLEKKLNNETENTSKLFSILNDFIVLSDRLFSIRRYILITPLYLKITIEIAVSMFKNNPESLAIFDPTNESEFNELWLYNKIFEHSFDDYFEKQGIDPTSASSLEKKSNEKQRIKNLYISLANNLFDESSESNEKHSFESLIKKNETEILERGFITRNGENYEFIHQTFGEYFFAHGIINGIEKGSLIAFELFILQIKKRQQICRFLILLILENINLGQFKITFDQCKSTIKTNFFESLLQSLVFDLGEISNFQTIYIFLWNNWINKGIKYKNLNDVPRFIEANFKKHKHNTIKILKYLCNFHLEVSNDVFLVYCYEVKLSILKNMIFDIIQDEDEEARLEDIHEHAEALEDPELKKNHLKIFLEALKFYFTEKKLSDMPNSSSSEDFYSQSLGSKNFFYLILSYICVKSNFLEIPVAKFFNDFNKFSKGSKAKEFYNLFKSRISEVEFQKKMDEVKFLDRICDIAIKDKIAFELLDMFCKDTEHIHEKEKQYKIGYKDNELLCHCIHSLLQKGFSFIESKSNKLKNSFIVQGSRNNFDDYSILYHGWEKGNKYLPIVSKIFKIAPSYIVKELGNRPYFGGNSITEHYALYESQKNIDKIHLYIYSTYIVKAHGEEALTDFLCKYKRDTNIEEAFVFGWAVTAFFKYQNKTLTKVRKDFIFRICEKVHEQEGVSRFITTIIEVIRNLGYKQDHENFVSLFINIFGYLKKIASSHSKNHSLLVYIYFKSDEYKLSYNSKLLMMKEIILDIVYAGGEKLNQLKNTEVNVGGLDNTNCHLKKEYGEIFFKVLKYYFEREDFSNKIYWIDLSYSDFLLKEKQIFYQTLSSICINLKFLESVDIFTKPNTLSNMIELSIPLNEKKDARKFIEKICDIALEDKIAFEFLDVFYKSIKSSRILGHHTESPIGLKDEELLCHCINYLLRKGFSFIDSENNSILYYYWKKDDIYWQIVENTLKLLPKNIFEQLGQSPHFGGRSISEHYELYGPQKTLLKYIYAVYIARVHGEEAMTDFLCEYNERTNLEEVLTLDLEFYKRLVRNIFEDLSKTDDEMNKEFVFKICENALKCEGEKRFLSVVTKTLLYYMKK